MSRHALLIVLVISFTGCIQKRPVDHFQMIKIADDGTGGGDASISPDGSKIVISSKRTGNWEVWLIDVASKQWTQLTNNPADDFEARFSPDGNRLVFTSTRTGHKEIWILNIRTHAVRRLTFTDHDQEYPSWSPDGRTIVYTGGPWGARDFWTIPAQGGTPTRLTRESGMAGACSYYPDGLSLVCHRYDYGSGDLFRFWLETREWTPLTSGTAWDYKPTVSSDARFIAFSRGEEGPAHIWLMPAEGGRAKQLTNTVDDDRWPTWSTKRNLLFFHRLVDRGSAVKLYDRGSGVSTLLVSAEEHPLQSSFDARTRTVVYCSQTESRKILKIRDLRNGTVRTLDTGNGDACYPRFSPDGTRIAFAGKPQDRWEIGTLRPDGSDLTWLTAGVPGLKGMDGPVDWSPNASKIVFHADGEPYEARLYVVDIRTRKVTGITKGHWFDEAPAWTPDGSGILFMSTRGGDFTWSLIKLSLVTRSMTTFAGPDWVEKNFPRMAVDGSMIWCAEDKLGRMVLQEKNPEGVVRTIVAENSVIQWPSYAANGRQIVYSTLSHRVEYWLVENPWGEGSPLLRKTPQPLQQPQVNFRQPVPSEATDNGSKTSSTSFISTRSDMESPVSRSSPVAIAVNQGTSRRSPVQLHHR